jgi:hypothetical protein
VQIEAERTQSSAEYEARIAKFELERTQSRAEFEAIRAQIKADFVFNAHIEAEMAQFSAGYRYQSVR